MNDVQSLASGSMEDRFGVRVCGMLSGAMDDIPYDVGERLRAARVRAVDRYVSLAGQTASALSTDGQVLTAGSGGDHHRLWVLGSLLALVLGFGVIHMVQDEWHAEELADVDADLLIDDLPPVAYVDPGFAQFLSDGSRWK